MSLGHNTQHLQVKGAKIFLIQFMEVSAHNLVSPRQVSMGEECCSRHSIQAAERKGGVREGDTSFKATYPVTYLF